MPGQHLDAVDVGGSNGMKLRAFVDWRRESAAARPAGGLACGIKRGAKCGLRAGRGAASVGRNEDVAAGRCLSMGEPEPYGSEG